MRRSFDNLRDSVQAIATAHFTDTIAQKRLKQRLLGGEYSPKKLQPGVVSYAISGSKKRFVPAPQNFFDLALILDDTVAEDIFSARVDNKGKLTGDEFSPFADPIFQRFNLPQGGQAFAPLAYTESDRLNQPSLFQEIFFALTEDKREFLKARYTPARINAMLDHCPDADTAIALVNYLGMVFDVRRTDDAGAELLTLLLQTALYEVLDLTERAQLMRVEPNEEVVIAGVKAILTPNGLNDTVPGIWPSDLGEMPDDWHRRVNRFRGLQHFPTFQRLNVHSYLGLNTIGFPADFTPTHLVNRLLPALADYNCDGGVLSSSKPVTKHACFVARAIASGRLSLLAFDNPFYDIAAQYLEDLNHYHVVDAREIALGRLIVCYMKAVIESGDKKNKWGGFYQLFAPEIAALFCDLSQRYEDLHDSLCEIFASSGLDLSQLKKADDFMNTVRFVVGLHAHDAQAVYEFLWQHRFAERGREMARNYFPNALDDRLSENKQRSADVKAVMHQFGFDPAVTGALSDRFIDAGSRKAKKKKKKKAKATTAGTQTSPVRDAWGVGTSDSAGLGTPTSPSALLGDVTPIAPTLSRDDFVDASQVAKDPLRAVDDGNSLSFSSSGGISSSFANELLVSLASDFHLVYDTENSFLVIPTKAGSSADGDKDVSQEREAYRYTFNSGGESEPQAVIVSFTDGALNAMPHVYYKQSVPGQAKASRLGPADTIPVDYLGAYDHPVTLVDDATELAWSDGSGADGGVDADDYDVSRHSYMSHDVFMVMEHACTSRDSRLEHLAIDPNLLKFMDSHECDQAYFSSPSKDRVVMAVVGDEGADFFEYQRKHAGSEYAVADSANGGVDVSRALLVQETKQFLVVQRQHGDSNNPVRLERVDAATFNKLLPKIERPETEDPVLNVVFDITEFADRFKLDDAETGVTALCGAILEVNPGGLGAEPVDAFYADFTVVQTPEGTTVRTPVRTPVQAAPGTPRMGTPGPSTPQRLLTPGSAMASPRTPVMKLRGAKIRTPGTGEVVHHDWVDLQNLAFLENAARQIVNFLNENLVALASGHEINEDFYNALFIADDDEIPLLQKLLAMVDTRADVLEGLKESFLELGETEAPIVTVLRAISASTNVEFVQKKKSLQCVTMYAYWLCREDAAQLLQLLPSDFERVVEPLYRRDIPDTARGVMDSLNATKYFLQFVMEFDLTPRSHADRRAGASSSAGPVGLAGNSSGTFASPGSPNGSDDASDDSCPSAASDGDDVGAVAGGGRR